MTSIVLSALMIIGIALIAGAVFLWRRGDDRKRILLMVVAALVMFANVAIWAVPTDSGETLAGRAKSVQ
ncbi:hypothetical protein [Novosphingopyxis sp.]|uniref:hypothetical protein n=1 Tax=Novosphingopyxis sp. TaxID=2709690 RepID=UPI003B5CD35D